MNPLMVMIMLGGLNADAMCHVSVAMLVAYLFTLNGPVPSCLVSFHAVTLGRMTTKHGTTCSKSENANLDSCLA